MRVSNIKALGLSLLLVLVGTATAEEIRPVHFPAVPDGWSLSINDNTVVYKSGGAKGKTPDSVVKFKYTRATNGLDAHGYIEDYINKYQCSAAKEHGRGFYTTSCKQQSTDAVVVGETGNLYLLEITGVYSKVAMDLLNTYLNDILKSKYAFVDRFIGDRVNHHAPPPPPPSYGDDFGGDSDAGDEMQGDLVSDDVGGSDN